MKGLILKDIELMKGNRRLYAGAYLIAVMMLFMTGMNTIFFVSYVSIMSGVIGLNTVSFDQADNGMAFLMTLPVSRKTYAAEKYIFGMCFCLVSWFIAMIISLAICQVTGNVTDYQEWFWGCGTGLWVAVMSVAICIPVEFKFRPENVRFIFIGVFVLIFGIVFAVGKLIQLVFGEDMEMILTEFLSGHTIMGMTMCLIVCILILTVSFRISAAILEKKEF
ncbi:MAG: ABC-2 transporter permease [Blautia sp.]|nr:ABC-2 transporter permease [Blautia sp.]MDY5031807.1 ABC-2 transporter permease [Blautia sp.]